ncbi:hypothetical protein V4F39_24590 [Aquincola sp. MAHUQ-54]|uniref:SapC protein n=1 Tax=Aquincola agrisoli TaxID=3119538 RepID=A0AAW9QIM7_9BURK
MNFESTLPFGTPDLMRVSDFQRYLDELVLTERGEGAPGFLASLSPSLMMDLQRVEQSGHAADVLVVLAASLRHGHALAVHLQNGERVIPLTVFPAQQLAHCPVPLEELMSGRLADLFVMHVEPAVMRPPGDSQASLVGDLHLYHSLPQLTWDLAMRGARDELLPEIAGQAAYRISPGTALHTLGLSGTLLAAVTRLQRQSLNLRDLSEFPGFDRVRASRLLNALYLQAGLIVSRTHPAAAGGR